MKYNSAAGWNRDEDPAKRGLLNFILKNTLPHWNSPYRDSSSILVQLPRGHGASHASPGVSLGQSSFSSCIYATVPRLRRRNSSLCFVCDKLKRAPYLLSVFRAFEQSRKRFAKALPSHQFNVHDEDQRPFRIPLSSQNAPATCFLLGRQRSNKQFVGRVRHFHPMFELWKRVCSCSFRVLGPYSSRALIVKPSLLTMMRAQTKRNRKRTIMKTG